MAKIHNFTPHEIRVVAEDNTVLCTLISEGIARVSSETVQVDTLNGIPVTETRFGEVVGLPAEEAGTYYVVSRMVASAATGRQDLLVPSRQVRDEKGNVAGCMSLDRA